MKQGRKLGLAVCTALGIGVTAPAFADDQTNYAPQYTSESQGSDSTAQQLTVIVTEPSLVFSDGAWYTYADGVWQQFDGSQWQNLTETSYTSYYTSESDEAVAAADEAMGDDYASLGADEIWFVWVPMSDEQPQLGVAEYDADAMSSPYYNVELSNVNGIPIYSQEDGQWYVLVPMASDEVSSVAYLY